ncbi:MAG: hypothetical protein K8I60_01565, partial [Anaerolineae bacterium]|nr:hypothetical protein [Anaerolineae bacterium]
FLMLRWKLGIFRRLRWIFLTAKQRKTPLRAILFSSYTGTHKSGSPQVSLDLDANRLVLLDRNNGESEDTPDESIPF